MKAIVSIPMYFGFVSVMMLLTGCATRSISDSEYYAGYCPRNWVHNELSAFNVLGINKNQSITEQEINAQYAALKPIKLQKETGILLIQSGAMFPDESMQSELAKIVHAIPFSGIAEDRDADYSKMIRLCAAKGGCDYILCYWGVLETSQKKLATKGISWVPIVGDAIPDETQQMRIRLKAYLIDVRTGQWIMFTPETIEEQAVSAHLNRESSDQTQVAALKGKAYAALIAELQKKCME